MHTQQKAKTFCLFFMIRKNLLLSLLITLLGLVSLQDASAGPFEPFPMSPPYIGPPYYGARAVVSGGYAGAFTPTGPSYADNDGGNGSLFAGASGSSTVGSAIAQADAALHTLRNFTQANQWMFSINSARSELYDTFTINSNTLPEGTPVQLYLDWSVSGTFLEGPFPAPNSSSVRLFISETELVTGTGNSIPFTFHTLVQASAGSDTDTVNLSGSVPINWLDVGDSFLLHGRFDTQSTNAFFLAEWFSQADFTSTGSFLVSSGTPGAFLTSASSPQPVPEPMSMVLFGAGAVVLAAYKRLLRRQRHG